MKIKGGAEAAEVVRERTAESFIVGVCVAVK
jgi:hypothetical protein